MVMIEPAPLKAGLYDRVGGWLVIPAIGTYLAPLRLGYDAFEVLVLYSDSLPPKSQAYILGFGLTEIGLVIAWIYACVLLSRLDEIYPKTYVVLALATLFFNVAVFIVAIALFGGSLTSSDAGALTAILFGVIVWVPYMLVSKRVKATFYGVPMPVKQSRRQHPLKVAAIVEHRAAEVASDSKLQYRRKGHRLGIFLTLVSVPLLVIGIGGASSYPSKPWADLFVAFGLIGLVFGYLLARLWYWFKAA